MPLLISKFKNVFILLAVLGGLLIIMGIVQGIQGGKNERNPASFFGVNTAALTKIRVVGVNGLYENILERRDKDQWVVANKGEYGVNPDYIADLFDIFQNMPKGEIASRNPEKHEELQVDDLGVRIQAWEKDEQVIDAIIGKEGPGFTTTYVRRADSDIVYLSSRNIRPIFNRTDWRDKRVWVFEPLKVTSIDWRYNSTEISLIKTGDGWQQVTPFSRGSSDERVGPVLAALSDLFAADIREDITREDAGLSGRPVGIRIELGFETGEKDALIVGEKAEGQEEYYVARENGKLIYTLDSWTVENTLKKEIGDF